MAEHNDLGTWGENLACAFLEDKGYVIVERDWRMGHKDIDIVALDGDVMVFVEVKTRRSSSWGLPAEAVGRQKMHHLQQAIGSYIQTRSIDREVRFDIISIVSPQGSDYEIEHFQDIQFI